MVNSDIQSVMKGVFSKILELGHGKSTSYTEVYLNNLLTPLRDYIYQFFEIVDTGKLLTTDYQQFSNFKQTIGEIFVAIDAYLTGVLKRAKLITLIKNKESIILSSDPATLSSPVAG